VVYFAGRRFISRCQGEFLRQMSCEFSARVRDGSRYVQAGRRAPADMMDHAPLPESRLYQREVYESIDGKVHHKKPTQKEKDGLAEYTRRDSPPEKEEGRAKTGSQCGPPLASSGGRREKPSGFGDSHLAKAEQWGGFKKIQRRPTFPLVEVLSARNGIATSASEYGISFGGRVVLQHQKNDSFMFFCRQGCILERERAQWFEGICRRALFLPSTPPPPPQDRKATHTTNGQELWEGLTTAAIHVIATNRGYRQNGVCALRSRHRGRWLFRRQRDFSAPWSRQAVWVALSQGAT